MKAYMSKALSEQTQLLSTYEREMLAIIPATAKWRLYLIVRRFTIRTGQRSLPYFLGQHVQAVAQQRWASTLLEYDDELVYKKGTEKSAADALSWRCPNRVELAAISAPVFPFFQAATGGLQE